MLLALLALCYFIENSSTSHQVLHWVCTHEEGTVIQLLSFLKHLGVQLSFRIKLLAIQLYFQFLINLRGLLIFSWTYTVVFSRWFHSSMASILDSCYWWSIHKYIIISDLYWHNPIGIAHIFEHFLFAYLPYWAFTFPLDPLER